MRLCECCRYFYPGRRRPCTVRSVTFVVRIRLSLADRAGALGQAATVIGLHGGNILSVDVHNTDGASAVDDLVVEFPTEPSQGELGTDLSMTAAASIIQMEPAQSVDVVTAVLAALRPVARTGTHPVEAGEAGPELIDSLVAVCPSSEWSVVEPPGTDLDFVERDAHQVQLAVPIPGSDQALMGRRTATMAFTATEMARVNAVVRLWACMKVTATR